MRPSPLLIGGVAIIVALAVASTGVLQRDPVEHAAHPKLESSVLVSVTAAWREEAIEALPSEVRCRAEAAGSYLCDVLAPGAAPVNLRVVLDGRCWTAGIVGFDGLRSIGPTGGPEFSGCL